MADTFIPRRVDMTDGSVLYEVVTGDGERIAAASSPAPVERLCRHLNAMVDAWLSEDNDHTGG